MLEARVDLLSGEEVTTGRRTPFPSGQGRDWPIEITFDGGARAIGGRRVAGAGVVVWGPMNVDGTRHILGKATVAIPGQQHVASAEAFGCHTALRWVAQRGGEERAVRISGDNLAVVRFCAHAGRLRRPVLQALLEGPLGAVYARGWDVEWDAIRRRFNQEADRLATEGTQWAARLAEQGVFFSTTISWA